MRNFNGLVELSGRDVLQRRLILILCQLHVSGLCIPFSHLIQPMHNQIIHLFYKIYTQRDRWMRNVPWDECEIYSWDRETCLKSEGGFRENKETDETLQSARWLLGIECLWIYNLLLCFLLTNACIARLLLLLLFSFFPIQNKYIWLGNALLGHWPFFALLPINHVDLLGMRHRRRFSNPGCIR